MRSQGYINKSFFNKSSSSQFKIEETAELTRLDTITYKHNRIIIEPSSPAQVAGFFVCGILVDYLQTLQNDQLESMLFKT